MKFKAKKRKAKKDNEEWFILIASTITKQLQQFTNFQVTKNIASKYRKQKLIEI